MISSKSYGLQNETRQYLRRLYAYGRELNGNDVNDIDNFIKGLKQLNLWQNTVCWPMRSVHNVGNGSTVLSLGGRGTYNGTIYNSASWGNGGITFATNSTTARDSRIDVTWRGFDLRNNITGIVVSDAGEADPPSSYIDQYFAGSNTLNGGFGLVTWREPAGGQAGVSGPQQVGYVSYITYSSQTVVPGLFNMWTAQRTSDIATDANTQNNKLFRNVTQIGNGSNSAQAPYGSMLLPTTTFVIGNGRTNTTLAPIGKISFTALINNSSVSVPTVYSLLRTTICRGLTFA